MVKLYLVAPLKEELLEGKMGNPYALLSLAGWVSRNSDSSVEIIQSIGQIKEKDAYAGISVTTPTYQKGLEFARNLKQKSSDIKTILGGYHTKGQTRFIARHPEIDFIVEGEGEKALIRILDRQKGKILSGESLTSEELDSIGVADLFKLDPKYFKNMRQFGRINYISTRGCPHSCSFCASSGKQSAKSTGKVIEDLESLARNGFHKISIQDNYFCCNPKRIEEICNEILRRGINIDWDCQTRVESMQDEDILKLMSEAGCSASYLGTENFHSEVLEKMDKTPAPRDYLRMVENAIQNMILTGIKPYLNLQLGLSYENEDIRQTNIEALRDLGRSVKNHKKNILLYTHLNVVYPGTPDFNDIVKRGVPEDIFEDFTKWEEENGRDIKHLLKDYPFVHGAGGIPLGVLSFGKLKERKFIVDKSKLMAVRGYIEEMRHIRGIEIYERQKPL